MAIVKNTASTTVGNPSFNEIAKQVMRNSIRSAVCIDDMFYSAYMSTTEKENRERELSKRDGVTVSLNYDTSSRLYRSFREKGNCDIDVYNFSSIADSWHPDYMLNNKDLLVLDWELDGVGGYQSTLEILKQAVLINEYTCTPFIVIYTSKPEADYRTVFESILSSFYPFYDTKANFLNKLNTEISNEFEGCFEEGTNALVEDFLLDVQTDLYEYWKVSKVTHKNEAKKRFFEIFAETYSVIEDKKKRVSAKLNRVLQKVFHNHYDVFESLYYLSLNFTDNEGEVFNKVRRIASTDIGIKVNSSIITVFSKSGNEGGVEPDEVLDKFTNFICHDPHNFLTILSLEMRHRFISDSHKIGERISSLSEKAFFYHLNNYKNRSSNGNYLSQFYDFLIRSWTNEIEAYNINLTPDIFKGIEDYQREKKLEDIDKGEIHQPLADLAIKLSTVNVDNRLSKDPYVRFGDIFKAKHPDRSYHYYLCITPHCVCVDAKKIDNNFFFLKAEHVSDNLKSTLEKIETGYYSLISDEGQNLSLKWGECKPFSLWIRDNNLKELKSKYTHIDIELEYVTSLKENFAQRMANKAFEYGMNVGIDLPHL